MPIKKLSLKRSLFTKRRYWYHVSSTIKGKKVFLKPRDDGFNRACCEPVSKRICVAPSISHCLTAIPYCPSDILHVYCTRSPVKANKTKDVFDAHVTLEGWIQKPTVFVKVGILNMNDVERGEGLDHVIDESASSSNIKDSRRVLRWWRKVKVRRYLKRP